MANNSSRHEVTLIPTEKIFVFLFTWYISMGPVTNWREQWKVSGSAQYINVIIHAALRTSFTVYLCSTLRYSYRSKTCTEMLRWVLTEAMIRHLELPIYGFSIWLYGEVVWPNAVALVFRNSSAVTIASAYVGLQTVVSFVLILTLMELMKNIFSRHPWSNPTEGPSHAHSEDCNVFGSQDTIHSPNSRLYSKSNTPLSSRKSKRSISNRSLKNMYPSSRPKRKRSNIGRTPSILLEDLVEGVGVRAGYTRSGVFYK